LPQENGILLGNVQDGQNFLSLADTICMRASFQGLQCDSYGMSPSGLCKMPNKMLIDASHQEEIRVVVTRGNRIEEFDFESEHKKQLKGNIYLARITRVEPSLQAAFVEYGGNRHGFLAFSEIHPDYYQIPVADRLMLLKAEEQAAMQDDENSDTFCVPAATRKERGKKRAAAETDADAVSESSGRDPDDLLVEDISSAEDAIELVGAEDALEEVLIERVSRRDYKIQEVIKRRQILLVQVMKEERGNKGAALTTYLSLAGRYSVLMPNTARGGGISRKITSTSDRKRLREIVRDLSVPKGMGIILRTAGANRTKTEVKRDYEYLMRLWENVRNLTLSSIAPALVYEEGNLIKRSIRDLYNKNVDEILVAGDKGYREAKNFMRMLMPSHAKVVQPYRDKLPIFARNGIETQLDRMLQPEVGLKSGGYLIINQTEALVAIDVNSGRSTREHSVEETAVQTNLEAAEEVARQLRLRDLAGLVVIDFIDMLEKRNIRAVEKKLKDCLKEDRARIQVGRISHFGLMEMSRQRIRASVLESTTQPCPYCAGTGYIRSESSVALHVVRSIEEYLLHNSNHNIIVRTPVSTALYVLNHKRKVLAGLEEQFHLTIDIEADDTIGNQHLAIYKGAVAERISTVEVQTLPDEETADEAETDFIEMPDAGELQEEHRKRRRRRGRRGGRRNREHDSSRYIPQAEPVGSFAISAMAETAYEHSSHPALAAVRTVGPLASNDEDQTGAVEEQLLSPAGQVEKADEQTEAEHPAVEKKAKRTGRSRKRKTAPAIETVAIESASQADVSESVEQKTGKKASPKRHNRKRAAATAAVPAESGVETVEESTEKIPVLHKKNTATNKTKPEIKETELAATFSTDDITAPAKGKRTGWWQRKGFF